MSKFRKFSESFIKSELLKFTSPSSSSTILETQNLFEQLISSKIIDENLFSKVKSEPITDSEIQELKNKLEIFLNNSKYMKYYELINKTSITDLKSILSCEEEFFKFMNSSHEKFEITSVSKSQYSLEGMALAWQHNNELNKGDVEFFITRPDLSNPYLESGNSDPIRLDRDAKSDMIRKIKYGIEKRGSESCAFACAKGGHWSLLVVDNSLHKFRYIDSLGSDLGSANLSSALSDLGYSKLAIAPIRQQSDGVSCGLWVIKNASTILEKGISAPLDNYPNKDSGLALLRRQNDEIFHKLTLYSVVESVSDDVYLTSAIVKAELKCEEVPIYVAGEVT